MAVDPRYSVAVAQRGWISAGQAINNRPLDRLRTFLAKGRQVRGDLASAQHDAGLRVD